MYTKMHKMPTATIPYRYIRLIRLLLTSSRYLASQTLGMMAAASHLKARHRLSKDFLSALTSPHRPTHFDHLSSCGASLSANLRSPLNLILLPGSLFTPPAWIMSYISPRADGTRVLTAMMKDGVSRLIIPNQPFPACSPLLGKLSEILGYHPSRNHLLLQHLLFDAGSRSD
jgi:hypothetical protein